MNTNIHTVYTYLLISAYVGIPLHLHKTLAMMTLTGAASTRTQRRCWAPLTSWVQGSLKAGFRVPENMGLGLLVRQVQGCDKVGLGLLMVANAKVEFP